MRCAVLSIFLMLGFSINASAEDDEGRFYWQLDGGQALFSNGEFNGSDVEFDEGWSFNIRAGLDHEHVSFEADLGLLGADYTPRDDDFGQALFLSLGVNLLLKVIDTPHLDWYVGAGGSAIGFDERDGGTHIEGRLETGFIIKPTKYVQFVPHYRFTALSDSPADDGYSNSQYISSIRLGIRFGDFSKR